MTKKDPETVLLVSEALSAGATAVYAQTLMAGLTLAHIEHPLLTPSLPGINLLSKAESKWIQPAVGLDWLGWRPIVFNRILAWIRSQNPALIHGLSERAAPICAKLAETLKLPCVLTVQAYPTTSLSTRHFDSLITVSEPLREHLVNKSGFPRERIRLIPPGVPITDASSDYTAPFSLPPLVVSIGDFESQSDFATFMESSRHVATEMQDNLSFIVSGEGPRESKLRKFARELKLDKIVTFCHGHTELDRLLPEATVYVQTARREGFPVRALQAMACGVPVVAAANGAILEVLEDGVTGFIVPPANHFALAEKTLLLLNTPVLRTKMGDAARDAVREHYSAGKMVAATRAVYRDVIE